MQSSAQLGKIKSVEFGFGGYQDAQFGITFTLGGDGWGVGDFVGFWSSDPSPSARWTVQDQDASFAKTSRKIIELLRDAKVKNVNKLVGIPVVCMIEGTFLKEWRVLKEVL